MTNGSWTYRRPAVKKGDILILVGHNIMGEPLAKIEVAAKTSAEKTSKKLYWSEVIHPVPTAISRWP